MLSVVFFQLEWLFSCSLYFQQFVFIQGCFCCLCGNNKKLEIKYVSIEWINKLTLHKIYKF